MVKTVVSFHKKHGFLNDKRSSNEVTWLLAFDLKGACTRLLFTIHLQNNIVAFKQI